MNRREKRRIILVALGLWLALIAMIVIAILTTEPARSTKAPNYDANCLAQPITNPIKDCKR